jgi:hypothetical protein
MEVKFEWDKYWELQKGLIAVTNYCAKYLVGFDEKIVGATEWRSLYRRRYSQTF